MLLKHYKYSLLRNRNTIVSGVVAMTKARVDGGFYITTLVAYKIQLSSMWE